MALKTRGKLMLVGLATFVAALTAGGVALANDDAATQPPVLRITTNDNSGQLQPAQQSTDGRDCPFGHDQAPAGTGTQNAGGDV
jgi:hypothetical protein